MRTDVKSIQMRHEESQRLRQKRSSKLPPRYKAGRSGDAAAQAELEFRFAVSRWRREAGAREEDRE